MFAALLHHVEARIPPALGPGQYAIKCPGGTDSMARDIRKVFESDPSLVAVQLDGSNAFGNIDRSACIRALTEALPEVAYPLAVWMEVESRVYLDGQPGPKNSIDVCEGIPQGDAASALVFSLAQQNAARAIKQIFLEKDVQVHSFVYFDDVTFIVPREAIDEIIEVASEKFRDIGISINLAKSLLWSPSPFNPTPDSPAAKLLENNADPRGIIVCGVPLTSEGIDIPQPDSARPIGDDTFVSQFLERVGQKCDTRRELLFQILQAAPLVYPDYSLSWQFLGAICLVC